MQKKKTNKQTKAQLTHKRAGLSVRGPMRHLGTRGQVTWSGWVSKKIRQMRKFIIHNQPWIGVSTTIPIKCYEWGFTLKYLPWIKVREPESLKPMQPLTGIWKNIRVLQYYHSKLELEGKVKHLRQQGIGKRPNAASALTSEEEEILWTAKHSAIQDSRALFETIWWKETEGSKWWEAVYYSGDRLRNTKVAERLWWRKWKGASGAMIIAHYQRNFTEKNIKQFPRIFSMMFSNKCNQRNQHASMDDVCSCGSCNFENLKNITRAHISRNAYVFIRFSSLMGLWFIRTLKRQNQAGGDTAHVTDFAQTWHKCWVWWVNDYGKNLV